MPSRGGAQAQLKEVRGQDRTRNNCPNIALQYIRAQPGDVADVIADIIGNGGGVTGVVFGYAGFGFTTRSAPMSAALV